MNGQMGRLIGDRRMMDRWMRECVNGWIDNWKETKEERWNVSGWIDG